MTNSIFYFSTECFFKEEVEDINVAQTILDGWKYSGKVACATHRNGKHQIYVSK